MGAAFGWMAEWSKALVSGTSLFGGESSNLSPIIFLFYLSYKILKKFIMPRQNYRCACRELNPDLMLGKHQ